MNFELMMERILIGLGMMTWAGEIILILQYHEDRDMKSLVSSMIALIVGYFSRRLRVCAGV